MYVALKTRCKKVKIRQEHRAGILMPDRSKLENIHVCNQVNVTV